MGRGGQGPLGLRLALAFVTVAALVAVLAVVFSERDISVLVQQRRDDLTQTLSIDAVSTYNTGRPGWFDVDLQPALELASSSGTAVAILDAHGSVVASNLAHPQQAPGVLRHPLILGGRRIGTLVVKFGGRAWSPLRTTCVPRWPALLSARPALLPCWHCSSRWWCPAGSPGRSPG